MVIMEMVKEFTSEETLIVHPHKVVRWFDLNAGIGMIARDGTGDEVFFHFTALPGQGYRTIRAGVPVQFEIVESGTGLTARNIQRIKAAKA